MKNDDKRSLVRSHGRQAVASTFTALVVALASVTAVQAQAPLEGVLDQSAAPQDPAGPTDPSTGDPGELTREPAGDADPDFDPAGDGGDDEPKDDPKGGGKTPEVETDVTGKAFFKSKKPAKLTFAVNPHDRGYFDDHEVAAKISLEHERDGDPVQEWKRAVGGSKARTVQWDGTKKNGQLSNPGKYRFKLALIIDGDRVETSTKKTKNAPAVIRNFKYFTHRFPVPAKHQYGDGFGAGRGHQGQDVFAKCGSPLLAARGGKVQANQFQSSAGFYVVIDGAKTGIDYFYAHMKKRSKLKVGDSVKTGEQIGDIGESGNASGCHVHFEMWTAPGWYEGGKAFSPTKQLKSWDKFS